MSTHAEAPTAIPDDEHVRRSRPRLRISRGGRVIGMIRHGFHGILLPLPKETVRTDLVFPLETRTEQAEREAATSVTPDVPDMASSEHTPPEGSDPTPTDDIQQLPALEIESTQINLRGRQR